MNGLLDHINLFLSMRVSWLLAQAKKKLARADSLNTIYGIERTWDNKGYSIAADYRFYLKKENKYPAQRGIYIGPYAAVYYLESTNTVSKNDDQIAAAAAGIQTNLLILNLGPELGYQFVIKNRVTIDLILAGPSIGRYRLKMKGVGQVSIEDPELNEAIQALRDILVDRYDWLSPLFDGEEVEVTGTTSTWNLGMRYVVQIGYRF